MNSVSWYLKAIYTERAYDLPNVETFNDLRARLKMRLCIHTRYKHMQGQWTGFLGKIGHNAIVSKCMEISQCSLQNKHSSYVFYSFTSHTYILYNGARRIVCTCFWKNFVDLGILNEACFLGFSLTFQTEIVEYF